MRPWLPYDAAQVRSTLRPLSDLTGDFVKTLISCERLLSDNSKFQHNAAGFVNNVRWWLSVEPEVENLKQRIKFHTTKILLITKPVEIQLLSDLRKDIWDVRRVVEEIRSLVDPNVDCSVLHPRSSTHLPIVPPELDSRFLAAFNSGFGETVDIKEFPLKEGFDALVFHFGESTFFREYLIQKTPELTQYLNLIKSRWILQRLMESSCFVHDSLWGRCIADIETNILREYRRFDSGQLTSPNIDVIERLQEHCFSIWLEDHDTELVPTLTDERASEEKLLEIALPTSQSNRKPLLVVFRKSDHELRLVHSTRDDQNEMFYEGESHEINIESTRFIPLYAVPDSVSSTSTNNVLFCNRQGQGEKAYSLEHVEDVHNLQQAVTGYNVGADLATVSWTMFQTFRTTESGKGRVQIWRAKSLPRMALAENSRGQAQSPTAGLPRQGTSLSSVTMAESIAATARGSLVYGKTGPAVLFSKPELPVVVIYTIIQEKWTFLHFALDRNVYISKASCHCKECKAKTICSRIIVESKGKLKIERHSADARDGINTWDLALLRKPPHPNAGKALSHVLVKYVLFTFASVQDKVEFQTIFEKAQKLRNIEEKEYLKAISER